ncbi:PIN domain-containing protein [Endothiovibrio diazotrophicus]
MSGPRYLLDTNILSDLIRHPHGPCARHIAEVTEAAICTSIVVACELRYGVLKRGSKTLSNRVDQLLQSIETLPLDEGVEPHYAEIRHHLTRAGTPIGPNDLLIAAHARSRGLTVVTANLGEFGRVPALSVENWLE